MGHENKNKFRFPGNPYRQSIRCRQIIEKAILELGGKMADVVRMRVYLTKGDRWKEAGRAHGEFFGNIRPASTFVEVSSLIDPGWMVEIEAGCEIE